MTTEHAPAAGRAASPATPEHSPCSVLRPAAGASYTGDTAMKDTVITDRRDAYRRKREALIHDLPAAERQVARFELLRRKCRGGYVKHIVAHHALNSRFRQPPAPPHSPAGSVTRMDDYRRTHA